MDAVELLDTQAPEEEVFIVHPAYDLGQTMMCVGFKETLVVDDVLTDRNVYVIATDDGFTLHHGATLSVGGRKVIFDTRNRVLISLSGRWDKAMLSAFLRQPLAPDGIYEEIKAVLKTYIELRTEALYGLVTAWIMATYFHRAFNASPFLFFCGSKQSGKSRGLDLLERLSMNAIKVKGVTVASLVDSVDAVRGTFLVDQAENLSPNLVGILADSYTVGGGKRRVVLPGSKRPVVEFQSYGPKAFASTKDIDPDLKDRCIEINMVRAEQEYPYPEAFLPIWLELRDKLYRLLLTRWKDAREIYQTAGQGVTHRVRELWRPLDTILTLENVADEETANIREAFLESMTETQASLSDPELALFDALKAKLGGSATVTCTASEIAERMVIPQGEKMTQRDQAKWVGRALARLGLYTKRLGRVRNKHAYLITAQHVADIYSRWQSDGTDGTTAAAISGEHLENAIDQTLSAENGRKETKTEE